MNSEVSNGSMQDAWDVRRAAQFLAISEKTLYRLAAEGSVPSFKVGGSLRFDPARLLAWRETQQRGGK
ncbi:helix-turn-helix domain-containing protein [Corallococcus sp. AS-1-6]|uniref:helix-turn-helix domain-containing protein n=1 Tax=Corallococcus sp. AS-1-6 TaxID=2874599 RepID=UPI001CBD5942|nr:helix-turn-helix domain-containing protein [Corallococcus sp. AS-1-6]MBZ4373195.1 helix-turn-helix domain-containing protein [Corallococcus sp. AS-1-6]